MPAQQQRHRRRRGDVGEPSGNRAMSAEGVGVLVGARCRRLDDRPETIGLDGVGCHGGHSTEAALAEGGHPAARRGVSRDVGGDRHEDTVHEATGVVGRSSAWRARPPR